MTVKLQSKKPRPSRLTNQSKWLLSLMLEKRASHFKISFGDWDKKEAAK
jgi:hypothetical protein